MRPGSDANALDKFWQQTKHRRRIAFRRRWLAYRKADFTLGVCYACQAVEKQQNIIALCCEIFGDAVGKLRRFYSHHRRDINRRGNYHRACQPCFAERFLHKFLYFATTFTNQANNHNVCGSIARKHAHEDTLTDARPCNETHALAFAEGKATVNGFNSGVEYVFYLASLHRINCLGIKGNLGVIGDWPLAVDRLAETINHSAKHFFANAA